MLTNPIFIMKKALKNNLLKLAYCLLLLPLTGSKSLAQNGSSGFSQYADNLIPFNPAYSAVNKDGSFTLTGHKELVGIQGGPTSAIASAALPIKQFGMMAGLFLSDDRIAIEHQFEINGFIAKYIQLSADQFLSASVNFGTRNYSAAYSTLDSFDPTFSTDIRETKTNVGFGIMLFSDKYFIGFSVPELSSRTLGIVQQSNLSSHYYLTAAYLADVSEDIKLKMSSLVSYVKKDQTLADLSGILYFKNQFGLGAGYRTNKQIAGIFSINFNNFRIGYSYQFGASGAIGGINNAIHEIGLLYKLGDTHKFGLL
jgi:type IX secretion system PorP/SprF family membrane protein